MAKKGELMAVTHLNIGLDNEMGRRLKESATKWERTLTQEARFALRKYLKLDVPADDTLDVSA